MPLDSSVRHHAEPERRGPMITCDAGGNRMCSSGLPSPRQRSVVSNISVPSPKFSMVADAQI